jgi:hypothetical protein
MPIDFTTSLGRVRLLLSDVDDANINGGLVFTDAEITAFLALEGNSVKRAAAQAIDVNASNEALASKVLKSQDLQTDGARLADAMRKHAAALRVQADREDTISGGTPLYEFPDPADPIDITVPGWL